MIDLLLASALSCSDSQHLIESLNKSRMEEKADLIETIKLNTEPGCYEGSEHTS
jgi:hypothetical protein